MNEFLLDILGVETAKEVPAVIPQEVKEDPFPNFEEVDEITAPNAFKAPSSEEQARSCPVEGASGTFGRALDTGDTVAVVMLSIKATNMEESLRYTVLKLCKRYMLDDCIKREAENASANEIRRFLLEYQPLIKGCLKELMNKAGFASIDQFLQDADMDSKRHAYQSVLDCIISRVKE